MSVPDPLSSFIPPRILEILKTAAQFAEKRHQKLAVVGGAVRDMLLGRRVREADLMVEAPAEPLVREIASFYGIEFVSYERFLTHTLLFPNGPRIDVVTAREETYESPARLPEVRASTFSKDLRRRDFTINAIACLLTADEYGKLLDPYYGQEDMNKKIIRALHPRSFRDDPTRLYRAARFAGRLGFQVEPQTESWIHHAILEEIPRLLSPVRRRHEFELILKEDQPSSAFHWLKKWGALGTLHPKWEMLSPELWEKLDNIPIEESSENPLLPRLRVWFEHWEPEASRTMMTDLSFEKGIKQLLMEERR